MIDLFYSIEFQSNRHVFLARPKKLIILEHSLPHPLTRGKRGGRGRKTFQTIWNTEVVL